MYLDVGGRGIFWSQESFILRNNVRSFFLFILSYCLQVNLFDYREIYVVVSGQTDWCDLLFHSLYNGTYTTPLRSPQTVSTLVHQVKEKGVFHHFF